MTLRVVAIDGAAGSGKSTLARLLARELGLPYVNTGSMYRALTLAALRGAVEVKDGPALARLMGTLEFTLSSGTDGELLIDGAPPSDDLESADVEASVSTVAKHPPVRSAMRAAQRALGVGGAVMEGATSGTVVPRCPQLFLVAAPDERAGRRVDERGETDVAEALHARDRLDARVNPHVPADDAIVTRATSASRDTPCRARRGGRSSAGPPCPRGPSTRRGGAAVVTVPRIAVVGRQNVGKSTLVNRLFGKRETIAHDDPGVTRDRVELEATWNGKRFGLIDTAGYLHRATGVDALAGLQSLRAIDEAQLVLLVVDVDSGSRRRTRSSPTVSAGRRPGPRGREQGGCGRGRGRGARVPRAGSRRSDRRVLEARSGSG